MDEVADDVGARHRIVHQAGGDRLARPGIVAHVLAERLADALDGAAVELAAHDHRVDDAADIVRRGVGDDVDDAGLRVDLDLADMTAVRPARPVHGARRVDEDAVLGLTVGELEEADTAVGADDPEDTLAVFDVGFGRLERLAGELPSRLDRHLGGVVDRRAGGEQRARAGAAEPRAAIGVALDDADLVDVDAEHVDDELCVGGRDPLSHRHRRGIDLDFAGAGDRDGDALLEDVPAGPFEERGEAAPAQLAAFA
jgi:hypothetical protein